MTCDHLFNTKAEALVKKMMDVCGIHMSNSYIPGFIEMIETAFKEVDRDTRRRCAEASQENARALATAPARRIVESREEVKHGA